MVLGLPNVPSQSPSPHQMSAERRESPRYLVSVPTIVTTAAGQTHVCEILDVSETGCRIRLEDGVQLFGLVKLTTEVEETVARVMWSEGAMAGLWFPHTATEEPQPSFLRRMWGQIRGSGRTSDG
jgi:hypothetical protein